MNSKVKTQTHIKLIGDPLGVSGLLLAACGGGGASTAPGTGTTNQGLPPSQSPPIATVRLGVNHSHGTDSWLVEDASDFDLDVSYASYYNFYHFEPSYSVSPTGDVLVDGEPIDAKSLEVPEGEVVLMSGSQDSSGFTVDHVAITHLLDAPVEAIDTEHGRMTILGQTVLLNSLSCTQISCIDPGTVPGVGDRILVSGYLLGAPGQMLATRVAPSVASGDYLITGGVQALDSAHGQFSLGTLTINYSQATLQNFPGAALKEADLVIVRGSRAAGATKFSASSLTYVSPALSVASGADAKLYGLVTSIDAASLTVNGQTVQLSDAVRQSCPVPLALNQEVSVTGAVGPGGVVVAASACATQATINGESITGTVESIDPVFGTLSILGFRVQASPATLLVNVSTQSQIHVGDSVSAGLAHGSVEDAWATWRLEGVAAGSPAELLLVQDDVTLAKPSISVRGRLIATDANTKFSRAQGSISTEEFFAQGWVAPSGASNQCVPAKLRISVSEGAGGSLTALAIDVTPGGCRK